MSNELEKIKKFITIKRDPVEETIKDENSTKFAVFLIAITITLSVIQTLLQNPSIQDLPEWLIDLIDITPPTVFRIIMDAIANNILFPILLIVLIYYIGNAIKGEAESLNHVIRAIGYSLPLVIISIVVSFLGLIPNIFVWGFVALVNVVLGFWFVIIVVFALMITFKKGALTGIGAVLLSALIAGIAISWTFIIP